jgi:hypothetical protein
MRPPFHPDRDQLDLVTILAALSDPTRLGIVATLAEVGEVSCSSFGDAATKTRGRRHPDADRRHSALHLAAARRPGREIPRAARLRRDKCAQGEAVRAGVVVFRIERIRGFPDLSVTKR